MGMIKGLHYVGNHLLKYFHILFHLDDALELKTKLHMSETIRRMV